MENQVQSNNGATQEEDIRQATQTIPELSAITAKQNKGQLISLPRRHTETHFITSIKGVLGIADFTNELQISLQILVAIVFYIENEHYLVVFKDLTQIKEYHHKLKPNFKITILVHKHSRTLKNDTAVLTLLPPTSSAPPAPGGKKNHCTFPFNPVYLNCI